MPISSLLRFRVAGLVSLVALLCLSGPAAATTFKIATLSPDGSIWMKLLREGAAEISERTGDRVSFKFYPGGVMGDDKTHNTKPQRCVQIFGGLFQMGYNPEPV